MKRIIDILQVNMYYARERRKIKVINLLLMRNADKKLEIHKEELKWILLPWGIIFIEDWHWWRSHRTNSVHKQEQWQPFRQWVEPPKLNLVSFSSSTAFVILPSKPSSTKQKWHAVMCFTHKKSITVQKYVYKNHLCTTYLYTELKAVDYKC